MRVRRAIERLKEPLCAASPPNARGRAASSGGLRQPVIEDYPVAAGAFGDVQAMVRGPEQLGQRLFAGAERPADAHGERHLAAAHSFEDDSLDLTADALRD